MKQDELFEKNYKAIKPIFDDIYSTGYHNGRHACRKKYVQSNYLIVDPEKINQLIADCEDPCKYCENYEPAYKCGCTQIDKCDKKQKQFNAIEIKKYFVDNHKIYD